MKQRYKQAFEKFVTWASAQSNLGYSVDVTNLKEYTTLGQGPAYGWEGNITSWTTAMALHVVICPYGSTNVKKCADAVHDNFKGPIMVWGGASDGIFNTNCRASAYATSATATQTPARMPNNNCFGFFTKGSMYMASGLEALASKLGMGTTVAVIVNSNSFSASVKDGAVATINGNANLTQVAGSPFTITVAKAAITPTDVQTIVTAMATNPDVVAIAGHNLDVEPVIIKIGEQSNTPKAILATNGLTNLANYGTNSKYAKCVMMPTQWEESSTATDPAMALTKAQFLTHMGGSATYQEAAAGAVGVALANGMHKVKTDNGGTVPNLASATASELLKNTMNTMPAVNSFYGMLSWDKSLPALTATTGGGGVISKPMYTTQKKTSGNVIVAPTNTNMMTYGKSTMSGCTCWDKSASCSTQTSDAFHGRVSMVALFGMLLGSFAAGSSFRN